MKQVVTAIFVILSCAACFGQSGFQEITPGVSSRSEVAKVLGQPVRSVTNTSFEYTPPAGIAKIEVEYRAGSELVERIEIYFARPVSRQALIKQFSLPQAADSKTSAGGALVEYFGGTALLALTYSSADASSGVSHVGYYSRELFATAIGKSPGTGLKPGRPTETSRSSSNTSSLGEMKAPDYMRGPGGSSSSTSDRSGRGSTSSGESSSAGSGKTKTAKGVADPSKTSQDGDESFTVTRSADGLEVQPAQRPGARRNNNADSVEPKVASSAAELRRLVGVYEFTQPTGAKPAEVKVVDGRLKLSVGEITYSLAPIPEDNFVVGDQGASEVFRFSAAGDLGVKVYFIIGEDKSRNLYIVENRRQPKRFSIAVAKP